MCLGSSLKVEYCGNPRWLERPTWPTQMMGSGGSVFPVWGKHTEMVCASFKGTCGIKLFRVITFILWWSTFFLFKDENAYDYSKNECFTHSSVHWMVWVWNNVNPMLRPSVSPDVSPTKWLWEISWYCAKLHHDHKNTKWGDIFSLLVSETFRINAYLVVVFFSFKVM